VVCFEVLVIRGHLPPQAAAEHVVGISRILANAMQLSGAAPLSGR
jgi:hypothetical protein